MLAGTALATPHTAYRYVRIPQPTPTKHTYPITAQYVPYNQAYNYKGYALAPNKYSYSPHGKSILHSHAHIPTGVATASQNDVPHAVVATPAKPVTGPNKDYDAHVVYHPEVHAGDNPVVLHYPVGSTGHHPLHQHKEVHQPELTYAKYSIANSPHPHPHHDHVIQHIDDTHAVAYPHHHPAVSSLGHHEALPVDHHAVSQQRHGCVNHLGYVVPCRG